ncbi:MerR family transcriptional regulator [Xenophilus aerolatus]|nr:MerR family transcriptional regulator [Xenophilus aerolatus]
MAEKQAGVHAGGSLPPIPVKRYFTIGEVGELCGVKPHVLRYWEQEFTQLRPMKRRGNRRYYQHHEVLMIRRIRDLLYDQGFTISGARNKLQELVQIERGRRKAGEDGEAATAVDAAGDADADAGVDVSFEQDDAGVHEERAAWYATTSMPFVVLDRTQLAQLRSELVEIRQLLAATY